MPPSPPNNPVPGKPAKKDPGHFGERDTDLDKFSHGNFDVDYFPDQAAVVTTFRAKYEFETGINIVQQQEMKKAMLLAIEHWNNSGIYLRTDNQQALNQIIDLRFRLVESLVYNKVIDVQLDHMRPYVFRDLNISIDYRYDIQTLAHELGHVFGNYDEYGGTGFMGWLERRMYWHDNDHLDDHGALMNEGWDFRPRYFDHYERWVNKHFRPLGIIYHLEQGRRSTVQRTKTRPIESIWTSTGVFFGYRPSLDQKGAAPAERPGPLRSRHTLLARRFEKN